MPGQRPEVEHVGPVYRRLGPQAGVRRIRVLVHLVGVGVVVDRRGIGGGHRGPPVPSISSVAASATKAGTSPKDMCPVPAVSSAPEYAASSTRATRGSTSDPS